MALTVTSFLLVLCSLVALGSALCTPDQWEGGEGIIGGYAGRRRRGLIREFVQVSYDATNNRTAAFLDYSNGPYENKFQLVTRYDEEEGGKLYVVDLKKNKCWTKDLKRPFRKACLPEDAKELGDFYLGLEGGFKATSYEVGGRRIRASVTVEKLDEDQIIPVGEAIFGDARGVGFVNNVGFINITPGIKNESVFDVPEQCEEKEEDFSLAEELDRSQYFLAI